MLRPEEIGIAVETFLNTVRVLFFVLFRRVLRARDRRDSAQVEERERLVFSPPAAPIGEQSTGNIPGRLIHYTVLT